MKLPLRHRIGGLAVLSAWLTFCPHVFAAEPDKSDKSKELILQGMDAAKHSEWQKAVDAYTEALKIEPESAVAFYQRCVALSNLNDFREALKDCREATKINPKYAEAFYMAGLIRSERVGDNRNAILDFDQAIMADPGHAAAYLKRGNARFRLDDKKGSLSDYSRAIELEPTAADAYFNRAVARYNTGEKELALEDLRMAAKYHKEQGDKAGFDRDTAAAKKVEAEIKQ